MGAFSKNFCLSFFFIFFFQFFYLLNIFSKIFFYLLRLRVLVTFSFFVIFSFKKTLAVGINRKSKKS
ncbi:unnamed protein product [Meloidogyne enterolobii]|uniref:Uncharacterized protein n=1 Tax=Meloidogyne enterolobii TaxID=390850 RepID=A0ACB0Z9E7_MELEN